MNNQDTPDKVKELLGKAEEYAELALGNFMLEDVIERVPETDEISAVINAVAEWSAKSPLSFLAQNHFAQLELHFLFPNMSPEERELLNRMALAADNVRSARINNHPFEEHLQQWGRRKAIVTEADIEKKLTAIQIEILDTEKFTPKGTK
jgi:hypothetical protein